MRAASSKFPFCIAFGGSLACSDEVGPIERSATTSSAD
jgi:hypothetical protein